MNRILVLAASLSFVLPYGLLYAQSGAIDASKLPGRVVDDAVAVKQGTWQNSTSVKPFVEQGYIYAGGPGHSVTFSVELPKPGMYHVLVSYTANPNRTTSAPFTVRSADGEQTVHVDQQKPPAGPYCFHPLGAFRFDSSAAEITVATDGTKGVVIADAVQVLTADELELAKAEAKRDPQAVLAKAKQKPAAPAVAKPTVEYEKPSPGKELHQLTSTELDELLAKHTGSSAAGPVDDEQFLRRASLDIIGRQPSLEEMAAFLAAESPGKRSEAVDRLLASPEYGGNWANYWSDVISFRVPEPQLTFLDYTTFKEWLAGELNRDVTWDEVVFRILTASGTVGANPAATFVGFHQADKSRLAAETSRVFLGVNIQCAECHDHPFIDMPQETFHHMAAFFVRTDAKLPWNVSDDIEVKSKTKGEHKMPGGKEAMQPVAFDSQPVDLSKGDLQRREALARWLVGYDNPWFAEAYTNRVWARLMGRGFCEPVDDIGEGADPLMPAVHAAVSEHFAATGYDTKALIRLIAGTDAYQRGLPSQDAGEAEPFAVQTAGRLRGDEVFDSLVTAVELPNVTPPAEKATGARRFPPPPKSTRTLVNEAYGYDPSLPRGLIARSMRQAMFMMNNRQIAGQVNADPSADTVLARLLADESEDAAVVRRLFERVLARKPNDRELEIALKHIDEVQDRRAAFEDLLWSLLNSTEFTARR